jgi:hypothetical protein
LNLFLNFTKVFISTKNLCDPNLLTEDDKKIINFLKNIEFDGIKELIKISHRMFYLSSLQEDLQKIENKQVYSTLLIFIFQNNYEIILEMVSYRIYEYITKNETKIKKLLKSNSSNSDYFNKLLNKIKNKINKNEHLTPHELNKIFNLLGVVAQNNNSKVFGEKGLGKLRNKFAHFNFYLIKNEEKIFFLDNNEIDVNSFLDNFKTLYTFLIELIYDKIQTLNLWVSILEVDYKIKSEFEYYMKTFLKVCRSHYSKEALVKLSEIIDQCIKDCEKIMK